MKRKILFLLVMLMGVSFAYAYSYDYNRDALINTDRIEYERTPLNKLARGTINTATCWAEIPAEVFKVSKERDPFLGLTLGFAQGIVSTVLRAVTGVFDVVTFVIPPYDKPLMEPEYAVISADERYNDYFSIY